MARLVGVKQFWTFAGFFAGSLVATVAGTIGAGRILEQETASTGMRILAVALGTLCFAPWLWFIPWLNRRSDEFERQATISALALAFGLMALVLPMMDYLEEAHFVEWGALGPRWWLMIPCWMVAMVYLRIRIALQQ